MQRVIVTGGAGFIGSHLVDRLLQEGIFVKVIDNFSSGRPQNLRHHKENKKLKIVPADVAEFGKIAQHFKGIDTVFHLAARADIVPSIVTPLGYCRANLTGTINTLEASRLSGVKKFIYAASSSCYGIPDAYPTSETAPIRPQYPYALSKYLGEEAVFHWSKIYKLAVISLRIFNVYGLRSRTSGAYGAVLGVFLAQKLADRPFTVVGDGKQKRDFVYVTDVAEAFVKSAKSRVENEIFNVGLGNPQSVNRLVQLLGGEKIHIPKRPGEPDCTWADISKIKKMLGWSPRVSFEQGIRSVLANIEYWKDAPLWTPKKISKATQEWFRYLSNQNEKR